MNILERLLKGMAVFMFAMILIGLIGTSCSNKEIEDKKEISLTKKEEEFIVNNIEIWKEGSKFENCDFKYTFKEGILEIGVIKEKIDYMLYFNEYIEKDLKECFEKDLFFDDMNTEFKKVLGDKLKVTKAYIYDNSDKYSKGEYYAMKYVD